MNDSLFADTSALVYAYGGNDPEKAEQVRHTLRDRTVWISTQVLSEFANVVTKKLRVAPALVRTVVDQLIESYRVIAIEPSHVRDALGLMARYRYSYYDSLIVAAALACEAQVLCTEDMHHGQRIEGRLTIRSPFGVRAEGRASRYRVERARPGRKSVEWGEPVFDTGSFKFDRDEANSRRAIEPGGRGSARKLSLKHNPKRG